VTAVPTDTGETTQPDTAPEAEACSPYGTNNFDTLTVSGSNLMYKFDVNEMFALYSSTNQQETLPIPLDIVKYTPIDSVYNNWTFTIDSAYITQQVGTPAYFINAAIVIRLSQLNKSATETCVYHTHACGNGSRDCYVIFQ
jgi:hypothetical protein